MTAPRFSVVVPAYNASLTIRETLDAMEAVEYDAWECVIVNDGSTDDTADIAREYVARDARFRLIEQENQGASAAHNTGVRNATGDYIVLCAADDFLLPRHMKVMDDLIRRNPDCRLFSCNGIIMQHDTREQYVLYREDPWLEERSVPFPELIGGCYFSVGACYERTLVDEIGGYRVGSYVDDYDLWLRAYAHGVKHRYTPEPLAVHRQSSFQQTASLIKVFESDIGAYRYLIDNGLATTEIMPYLERSIAQREQLIRDQQDRIFAEKRDRIREQLRSSRLTSWMVPVIVFALDIGQKLRRTFSGK